MKIWKTLGMVVGPVAMLLVVLVTTAPAQEKPKAPEPAAVGGMPPLPQPGPEQAVLKQDVGVWDATVEMFTAPGAAPTVSTGVETNTLGCGGLCLITDFKSEMMGMSFAGHSVSAYDATKKKYVSTWMDSMSLGPSLSESTYDAARKMMDGTMQGPDMSGQVMKMRTTAEWKDADTRVATMYSRGPDGKESPGLRITYKRRK